MYRILVQHSSFPSKLSLFVPRNVSNVSYLKTRMHRKLSNQTYSIIQPPVTSKDAIKQLMSTPCWSLRQEFFPNQLEDTKTTKQNHTSTQLEFTSEQIKKLGTLSHISVTPGTKQEISMRSDIASLVDAVHIVNDALHHKCGSDLDYTVESTNGSLDEQNEMDAIRTSGLTLTMSVEELREDVVELDTAHGETLLELASEVDGRYYSVPRVIES